MCVQKKLLNRNLRDGNSKFSFREIKGKVFIMAEIWEGGKELGN